LDKADRRTFSPMPPSASWSTIEVAGHPCELHAPPDPLPGRVIIALHDADGRALAETSPLARLVETHRIPLLAPRAGRSWWLDRIVPTFDAQVTPERHVVDAVRAEAARRFGVAAGGIALVGVGMGGQGALRLAYRHPAVFPVAAAIAPAVDFHLALRAALLGETWGDDDGDDVLLALYGDTERARQDTAILHVHPLNWPRHQWFASDPREDRSYDGTQRLHGKLVALGIPHTALFEPRGDGSRDAFEAAVAPDAIRFVLEALDAESRRIA
jgi:pimeloyl-ACP methyl ester carboxylesterase